MTWVHDRSRGARVGIVVVVAMLGTVVGVLAIDRGSTSLPALAAGDAPGGQVAANAVGASTRYVPINPMRVLDTRTDPVRPRLAAERFAVDRPGDAAVATRRGRPTGQVPAVVLNITMVDADGRPATPRCGRRDRASRRCRRRTPTSPVQTVANLVTVPVGVDGYVSLFSSVGADYIVDVQGVYAAATSATSGRFVPLDAPPGRRHQARRATRSGRARRSPSTSSPSGCPPPRPLRCSTSRRRTLPPPGSSPCGPPTRRCRSPRTSTCPDAGVHRRQPGDRSRDERRTRQRVLRSGQRRDRRRQRLHDRRSVRPRCRRAVRAARPGPAARHPHRRRSYSSGQPIASGSTVTLPIAGRGGRTEQRRAGRGPQRHRHAHTGARLRHRVAGEHADPATSSLNFVAAGRTVPNHVVTRSTAAPCQLLQLRRHRPARRRDGLLARPTGCHPARAGRSNHGQHDHAARHHDAPGVTVDRRGVRASSTRTPRSRSPARTAGGIRVPRSGTWPTSTGRRRRWSIR